MKDGDLIHIDINNGVLELKVSDEELEARRAALVPHQPKITTGYLARYAQRVTSASQGAIFREDI